MSPIPIAVGMGGLRDLPDRSMVLQQMEIYHKSLSHHLFLAEVKTLIILVSNEILSLIQCNLQFSASLLDLSEGVLW